MTRRQVNNDAQALVRMTHGTFDALDRVADKYGVKRTQVIREMLTQCLHAIGEPIIEPDNGWETFKKKLARDLARRDHV